VRPSALIAILALSIALSAALVRLERGGRVAERSFFAMNTLFSLRASGRGAEGALSAMEEEVRRLEAMLSARDPSSELSALSRAAPGPMRVSPELDEVLRAALEVANLSEGAFDPTVGVLTELWGIGTERARVPEEREIEEALRLVDRRGLRRVSEMTWTLGVRQKLDLGGIAKGYCGDRLLAMARSLGLRWALLDLGGNIVLHGSPGRPWRIGIQHPMRGRGGILGVLEVESGPMAVVTSGVYERFLEVDGKVYHHILDPKTGRPAEGKLASVTVVMPSSTMADALSTAFFVLGPERSRKLAREMGARTIWVLEDGTTMVDEELVGRFELTDKSLKVVVLR